MTGCETLPIYKTEEKRNEKRENAREKRGITPGFGQIDWHVKVQEEQNNTSTVTLIVIQLRVGSRYNNVRNSVHNSYKVSGFGFIIEVLDAFFNYFKR